jgi:hypothetical protein
MRDYTVDENNPIKNLQAIIDDRKGTHGDFTDVAAMAQALKKLCRHGQSFDKLTPVQVEGLDMILHKVARILSGNPNEPDHWLDVEGYARIVRERL